jgi:type IV secretory pathway VirD2 relaxase
MARRFVDRPDDLDPPLAIRQDRQAFITRATHRHRLPNTLRALGARGVYVPTPPASSQAAVVKIWPAGPQTTAAHLSYLEHGKGLHGQDALLFTDASRALDRAALIAEATQDAHQHRLILTLPDTSRIDLPQFTREFMARVERDVGAKLTWVAAEHHDTGHPHVHVLVRGQDHQQRSVYFLKHYWTHGLRYRAMQLATEYLGRSHRPHQETAIDRTMTTHMWETRQGAPVRTLTKAQVQERYQETARQIATMQARLHRRAQGRGLSR